MEQEGLIEIFESHHKVPCPEMVSKAGYGAEPSPVHRHQCGALPYSRYPAHVLGALCPVPPS